MSPSKKRIQTEEDSNYSNKNSQKLLKREDFVTETSLNYEFVSQESGKP